jgi:hypothetical protein
MSKVRGTVVATNSHAIFEDRKTPSSERLKNAIPKNPDTAVAGKKTTLSKPQ